MHTLLPCIAVLFMCFVLDSCSTTRTHPLALAIAESTHRYFLEIERPGSVYSILSNPQYKGGYVQLVEIDEGGQPGDTLNAWVQHYNGRRALAQEAASADLIVACYREEMPNSEQSLHVLPESTGDIFVYMMQGGVLIISDEKISFYEVLLAVKKSRNEVVRQGQ